MYTFGRTPGEKFYKPKGRPVSADVIRYALNLRYTSLQAYKLLLNKCLFFRYHY